MLLKETIDCAKCIHKEACNKKGEYIKLYKQVDKAIDKDINCNDLIDIIISCRHGVSSIK